MNVSTCTWNFCEPTLTGACITDLDGIAMDTSATIAESDATK